MRKAASSLPAALVLLSACGLEQEPEVVGPALVPPAAISLDDAVTPAVDSNEECTLCHDEVTDE